MLVDIGGVHLWQGAIWKDTFADQATLKDSFVGIAWEDKTPKPWKDYFGGQLWENKTPKPWKDYFDLRDQLVLDGQAALHQRIEERSTAELEVYDEFAEYLFKQGQEVLVFDPADMSILFGGLIVSNKVEVVTRKDTGVPVLTHSIQCSDYHLIAEKRVFNKAYVAPSALTIAYDILAVMAEDGIILGEIQDGGVLPDQLFSFVMCSDALDTLAKLCGFTWWIDQNKQLYFVDYTTYPADWNILDGSEILFSDGLDWTPSGADYRNVQWVNGGKALTLERTETIKGDGYTKSFPLGFPLAKEPIVIINGVEKDVGIKGVETGKDWYWNEGDNTIYQDDTGTPLAYTDLSQVQYYGQYPLVAKVHRAAEITRNKLLMGFGSGKVENIYVDASILDVDSAIAAAEGLLGNYAQEGALLHYKTYTPGLAAGTLQTVTLDYFGLDEADLLLLAVDTEFIDGKILYTVEAALGPVDPSWTKIFCKIASSLKAQAIQNVTLNSSVQGLEEFTKNWLSSYHPNPFIVAIDGYTPSSIDFPCLDPLDRLTYIVLYNKVDGVDTEFFRKVIASQTENDAETEIDTIALVLVLEANDVVISAVGVWGGINASDTPGSGIEMEKFTFNYTKTHLESLQFDFADIKYGGGW